MSQIANVIEMRREAERDFVRAAACGIVQRVIEADSVLAVCPAGLITHDLQAQAVYSAIAAIAADHKRPDPVTVGEWVNAPAYCGTARHREAGHAGFRGSAPPPGR